METERRYKFEANVWIKVIYKCEEVIGRTYLKNSKNLVVLITKRYGKVTVVDFKQILNIKKIIFDNNCSPLITTSLQYKKRLTIIEQHILETLKSINN